MSTYTEMREHSEAYNRIMMKRRSNAIRARRRRARFAVKFAAASLFVLLCAVIFGKSTLYASVDQDKAPTYKYYTSICIERNDTLDSIAREYISCEYSSIDKYISEVKSINHLEDDTIHAGNYIVVPYYSSEIK